jgi:ATP-dependent Lhr-like helicase
VRQTLHDCLTDAMDVDGLRTLIERIEDDELEILCVDTIEPSPLAHEILNGRPYTYLDDAPLEERRTRAVKMRRGLPVEERDLTRLDANAIQQIREQAAATPRDPEELHDLLLGAGIWRVEERWEGFFRELEAQGRAFLFEENGDRFWAAAERVAWARALYPEATERAVPGDVEAVADDEAIAHVLRGHLETTGPIKALELARRIGVRPGLVEIGLARLESEGFVLRGRFEATQAENSSEDEFCARRLLARIHSASQSRLRASVEPATARDMMRFLFAWQHVTEERLLEGAPGVARVVEQLQGFDLAAGAWESEVLPARIRNYQPEWLDPHCLSGSISWLRIAPPVPKAGATSVSKATPSKVTPLSLVLREDLPWLLQAHRAEEAGGAPVGSPLAEKSLGLLGSRGALFHSELVSILDARPVEVEAALWELVAKGRVGADGFQALRSLLGSRGRGSKARATARARRGLRRGLAAGVLAGAEGRWALVPQREKVEDLDGLAEAVAEQLLVRWGIVFRDVVARENLALPWREIVWAMRRLEARGSIRGGRFVSGFTGEQFALPEALEMLARVRKAPRSGERVRVCGSDPLNLVGILTPGDRVPGVRNREIVYVDGLPVDPTEAEAETETKTETQGERVFASAGTP